MFNIKLNAKTKKWLKAAGVRAAKTAAETAIAVIGSTAQFDQVDWRVVLSSTVLAVIVSLLLSIKGLPEVEGVE